MDRKGVSPIIAMILIVLITLSLAGSFLIWTQRTATQLTEEGTEQQQRLTTQFSKGVRIEAADCSKSAGADTMVIRNSGQVVWRGADLTFFINSVLNTSSVTFDNNGNIAEGAVVKATFGQDVVKNDVVKVVFQEVSDSVVCK